MSARIQQKITERVNETLLLCKMKRGGGKVRNERNWNCAVILEKTVRTDSEVWDGQVFGSIFEKVREKEREREREREREV